MKQILYALDALFIEKFKSENDTYMAFATAGWVRFATEGITILYFQIFDK